MTLRDEPMRSTFTVEALAIGVVGWVRSIHPSIHPSAAALRRPPTRRVFSSIFWRPRLCSDLNAISRTPTMPRGSLPPSRSRPFLPIPTNVLHLPCGPRQGLKRHCEEGGRPAQCAPTRPRKCGATTRAHTTAATQTFTQGMLPRGPRPHLRPRPASLHTFCRSSFSVIVDRRARPNPNMRFPELRKSQPNEGRSPSLIFSLRPRQKTLSQILSGLMGFGLKWLGREARWWNTQIKVNPSQVHIHPVVF